MSQKRYKILLIDDDQDQIVLYQSKFELEGFEFFNSRFGNEGVTMAEKKQPDLILLDLILIQEDGQCILRELKKNRMTKKIPVIILTNLAKKDLAERCAELGAVDFIIKAQTTPGEIVKKVKTILKSV